MVKMKFAKAGIFIPIAMLVICTVLPAQTDMPEYGVKAAFLERFTRFVDWPEPATDDKNKSKFFVIAVIGKNPFNSILEQLYSNRKIKNKPVKIMYISEPEEIPDCHILFISESMKNKLGEILAVTGKKPILTVGDTKGFAEKKVHINLYVENEEFPFEINGKAVRESGLSMDYRLLEFAKVVE